MASTEAANNEWRELQYANWDSLSPDNDTAWLRQHVYPLFDELLTHLPVSAARFLVAQLPAGWDSDPRLLLVKDDFRAIGPAISVGVASQQWGSPVVTAAIAGDPAAWQSFRDKRLAELNAAKPAAAIVPVAQGTPTWLWLVGAGLLAAGAVALFRKR